MDAPAALQQLFNEFLYKPESEEDLRTISNTGNVRVPEESLSSCYRCAYCDKMMGRVPQEDGEMRDPISCWRKCESVLYCSHSCQNDDWNSHRILCTEVRRCQKIVRDLSTEYGETNGIMDIFDRSNQMVFYFCDPIRGLGSVGQNYLSARMNLVQALMQQAMAPMVATAPPPSVANSAIQDDKNVADANSNNERGCHYTPPPHWNRWALELVLEHCLDLLHLDPIQTDSGTARTMVAHCLLILERYQELYEFVKYTQTIPSKLRSIKRKKPVFCEFDDALNFALEAGTFLNVMQSSQQPFFENQTQLVLRPPSTTEVHTFPGPSRSEVITVLYLALAKLLVYQEIEGIRFVQSISSPALPDLITAHIADFLGIQTDWMVTDGETIRQQCIELLAFSEASIPGILQDLVLCPVPQSANKPSSSMELLKTVWVTQGFPWNFLLDYLKNEITYKKCNVPRHDFLRRVFDRVYATYFELKSMQRVLDQVRDRWDRQKDSPAARQLLLEEVENGNQLYQLDFCVTRIVCALNKAKVNLSVLEQLLGSINLVDVAMDAEMFLAIQHLEKVRFRPEVASLIKVHNIPVPDEDIDPEGLEVIVGSLASAESHLTTETTLKLLFGDGGRVHELLRKSNVAQHAE